MKLTESRLKQIILETLQIKIDDELMSVESAEMFARNMLPENIFVEPMSFKKGSAYWQWDQIARAMDLPRHPNTVKEEVAAMYKLLDSEEIQDEKRGEVKKVLLALMMRPE
tara:strand:+ start:980 stop:1312 length:333 start_codon:yes stop_codon:yes gene_type:complete